MTERITRADALVLALNAIKAALGDDSWGVLVIVTEGQGLAVGGNMTNPGEFLRTAANAYETHDADETLVDLPKLH